jgi:hypothetical protein
MAKSKGGLAEQGHEALRLGPNPGNEITGRLMLEWKCRLKLYSASSAWPLPSMALLTEQGDVPQGCTRLGQCMAPLSGGQGEIMRRVRVSCADFGGMLLS